MFRSNKYTRLFGLLLICAWAHTSQGGPAHAYAGLIKTKLDTLHVGVEEGYDFVNMAACLGPNDNTCEMHIRFWYYGIPAAYTLFVPRGYGFMVGDTCLDSIKSAPSDSIFKLGEYGRAGYIPPDSLAQYIGKVYVIKTGEDTHFDRPLYAKLRILDFTVRDNDAHKIDMVFVWACNWGGYPDLHTANLDTFTLDYHVDTLDVTTAYDPVGNPVPRARAGSGKFTGASAIAINGRVRLPAEILTPGREIILYDQRGRVLGRVGEEAVMAGGAGEVVEINVERGYSGVVVVR